MNLPNDVQEILDTLLSGVHKALADNLVAVYLRGSLATGEFMPEISDLDILAVTDRPVTEAEFASLVALHASIEQLPNRYADRIEIAYIDRGAMRQFEPGLRHPTLGQGETLARTEHGANWILERWTVRERGITLFGPDPNALIDPISSQDVRAAVYARLRDWADWTNHSNDPDWKLGPGHKKYVVETMCRALYSIAFGELSNKRLAVAWALETFPEPWRSTVERSQIWRDDGLIDSATLVPEVKRFVLWASEEGQTVVE
jgi:predicted nucleotidyltransferase